MQHSVQCCFALRIVDIDVGAEFFPQEALRRRVVMRVQVEDVWSTHDDLRLRTVLPDEINEVDDRLVVHVERGRESHSVRRLLQQLDKTFFLWIEEVHDLDIQTTPVEITLEITNREIGQLEDVQIRIDTGRLSDNLIEQIRVSDALAVIDERVDLATPVAAGILLP